MVKRIQILNQDFFYKIWCDCDEAGNDIIYTEFFQEYEVKTRKKYWLFGPIIKYKEPKILFEVPGSVENPDLTKAEVRKILEKKVELISRKEQIKKGEII